MKEKTRLKLKIISSFIMCALSLFSIVSLTVAWFAVNDKTDGNGMAVTGSHDNDVVGYEFYGLTKDNASGNYSLKLAQNASDALGEYDTLASDYSAVLKIYLTRRAQSDVVKLSVNTTADYFLGDNVKLSDGTEIKYPLLPPKITDISRPQDDGKNYTNSLTSVIAFSVFSADEAAGISENGYLTDLPTEERLTTLIDLENPNVDGTHTPKENVYLTQLGSEDLSVYREIYRGVERDALYVFLTYDALLINTVFSANIGNDDMYLNGENGLPYPIPFVCDFSITVDIT